jgi:hypothetical protein
MYDGISRYYTGWTLTDIKTMTHREREHWANTIRWRNHNG